MTAATLEQVEADLAPSTDQETQREIAEVLGITEVDVAVRTSHARAELTRRLGRQHEHQLSESRLESLLLAAEYVTGAIIVGLVACKLATDKGADTFIRGFAMLWFTAMALQFTSTDRRGRGAAAAPGFPRGFRHVPRSGSMTVRLQPATVSSSGQAQPTPHPPDSHHEGYSPMKNTIIKALGIAAVAALATGCVSTSKFDEHVSSADAAIKAAQQSAAAAQAAADAASKSAASASSTASAAQSTANQALQAAQASQACCDATNEKIDRAFKKSMGK